MQRLRDPTASAEVVRRLNLPWWCQGPEGTDEAFCRALAFVETELAHVLWDAVKRCAAWQLPEAPPAPAEAHGAEMRSPRALCTVSQHADPKHPPDIKTHTAPHHHDDVVAVVLCLHAEACRSGQALGTPPRMQRVVRARDKSLVAKWTVDVDGVYDPERRLFDHHQHDERLTGHSAASLVWASHGTAICERWCLSCGLSPERHQPWKPLLAEVHRLASSYVQYAADQDNCAVRYTMAWPDPPAPPLTEGLSRALLEAHVAHLGPDLRPQQRRRVVGELAAAVKRLHQAETEQVVACSGVTGMPYADDYGAVGRHRRGGGCRDVMDLAEQLVADAQHEAEAEAVVQEALDAAAGEQPPPWLVLARGTKDLERMVLRNPGCAAVRFVAWPQADGYTVKGLRGALLPRWWWSAPEMAKAVRYSVAPDPGCDAALCALVGLPDVKFVHKAGWIASVVSRKSAEIVMRQAAAAAAK